MRSARGALVLTVAITLVCALVAWTALVASRVSNAASALASVVEFSGVVQHDIKNADLEALSVDLRTLDDRTQSLLVAVSDPVLSAGVEGLPYIGAHLDAVRDIASAVAGLTFAARPLATVLPALAPDKLVSDGQYDTATLAKLDSTMREIQAQLGVSIKQVAAIDASALDDRVANVVTTVLDTLQQAGTLVDQVEPLVGILPVVLGQSGSHKWLVVLQNLAEARGTGGILGAYAVLDVDDGHLAMAASGSDRDLIPTPVPFTGLPEDVTTLWGQSIDDIRSVNVSPNFPYAGRLYANSWKAVSGEDVDGVLAFGQGIVQYLLAATGAVTIDGETVDASNVVQFLSLGVYEKYPDATDKNAFVSKLVAEIFQRLQKGAFDLPTLLSATATTATSDRLLAWSPDADTQAELEADGYAGELPTGFGPDTAVAINNGSGNKLEQFLHVTADYSLGTCNADFLRDGNLTLTLTNSAPTSGLPSYVTPRSDRSDAPVGSTLEIVSVYTPVGSGDGVATLDGKSVGGYIGTETNHPLFVFAVDLDPGESRTITMTWQEPTAGPSVVDTLPSQPQLIVPPSLNPWTVTTPAATACR